MAGGAQPLKTSLSPARQRAFSYQPPLTLRAATSTVKRKSTETETKKKYLGTAGDASKMLMPVCCPAHGLGRHGGQRHRQIGHHLGAEQHPQHTLAQSDGHPQQPGLNKPFPNIKKHHPWFDFRDGYFSNSQIYPDLFKIDFPLA